MREIWQFSDIQKIKHEKKKMKDPRYDNMMFKKILLLTLAFCLVFALGNADCIVTRQVTIVSHEPIDCFDVDLAASWRCKGCGYYIWKDQADNWQGEYICDICGTKMGEG